jgi:hypothetical protein
MALYHVSPSAPPLELRAHLSKVLKDLDLSLVQTEEWLVIQRNRYQYVLNL